MVNIKIFDRFYKIKNLKTSDYPLRFNALVISYIQEASRGLSVTAELPVLLDTSYTE